MVGACMFRDECKVCWKGLVGMFAKIDDRISYYL